MSPHIQSAHRNQALSALITPGASSDLTHPRERSMNAQEKTRGPESGIKPRTPRSENIGGPGLYCRPVGALDVTRATPSARAVRRDCMIEEEYPLAGRRGFVADEVEGLRHTY